MMGQHVLILLMVILVFVVLLLILMFIVRVITMCLIKGFFMYQECFFLIRLNKSLEETYKDLPCVALP